MCVLLYKLYSQQTIQNKSGNNVKFLVTRNIKILNIDTNWKYKFDNYKFHNTEDHRNSL